MSENTTSGLDTANELRREALSRWDNEGGALSDNSHLPQQSESQSHELPLTNAELVLLRVRVIALENLLIALLAEASDHQKELVRDMASYISPRDGFTEHPLTIRAAEHMTALVDRASKFKELTQNKSSGP
ncbi:MAG: hypothetical protein ACSHXI_10045 [Hoeflea sp.]|uniref:hypothetical protein n=1 Tax=Hoeflea sp. TaxID=1940281 RepID=UPI003EF63934